MPRSFRFDHVIFPRVCSPSFRSTSRCSSTIPSCSVCVQIMGSDPTSCVSGKIPNKLFIKSFMVMYDISKCLTALLFYWFTYLSTYSPVYYPPIYPPVYLLIYLIFCLPIHPPTHLPTHLPSYLLTYLLTYSPIHRHTYLRTHPPTYLPVTHPTKYLSVDLLWDNFIYLRLPVFIKLKR